MPGFWFRRSFLALVLIFLLAAASPCLAQPGGRSGAHPGGATGRGRLIPRILPKVLAEGAVNLQGKIKLLAARLADSQQQLAQAQKT